MRSSILAVAACAAVAKAVAINQDIPSMKRSIMKRQSTTVGAPDDVVLNFALTLEHLEDAFYKEGLAKFSAADFEAAGYTGAYPLLEKIAEDEASHVAFLTGALEAAGATPVQACNYTFPIEGVDSFLALSQVLEGVGTSAYLGAAGSIETTAFLTAAGSILTVEARHNAFIRYLNELSPFPSAYDTPQSAAAVVTMATPFFASCPEGSAPAIAGKEALTVTSAAPAIGASLEIAPTNSSLAATFEGIVYCGFASGLGAGFSVYENGACMIPTANVTAGQTYVVLTSGPSVADASVLAGPAIIELAAVGASGSGSASGSASPTLGGSATATGAGAAASPTLMTGGASTLAKFSVASVLAGALALLL